MGREGLDNALSGIYDVILLDVMLPKLNGYQVAHQLRAEGNRTPVLMLTAPGPRWTTGLPVWTPVRTTI